MTLVWVVEMARLYALDVVRTMVQASIEGAAVALVVSGLCRNLPAMPAAVRAWLWWLVALKLLVGVLPVPGLPLALLPAPSMPRISAPNGIAPPRGGALAPTSAGVTPVEASRRPSPTRPRVVSIPYMSLWPVLLCAGWLAVVALHATRLWRAVRDARRMRLTAEPAPGSVATRVAALAARFGLTVAPEVLASRTSTVPLLTGVRTPTVLLPLSSTTTLDDDELDLVLGHEFAHVRRGDLCGAGARRWPAACSSSTRWPGTRCGSTWWPVSRPVTPTCCARWTSSLPATAGCC